MSARTPFLRRYLVRTHNAPQPGATTMARLRPDPSFYASPKLATEAPPEELAYVALLATGGNGHRDALGVVDTNPASPTYGRLVGRTEFPHGDNEAHPFGWNACSSHLCPWAPTRTSSAGIWSCPAPTRRASTFSTPSPTPASPS